MNNWIHVSEKVPDSITSVIVFDRTHGVGVGYYNYFRNPPEWKRYVGIDTFLNLEIEPCDAIYWMPFPGSPGNIALEMYVNEPCRICGRLLTSSDIESAVFAGYSADSKSRAAHEICWKNAMEIKK